MTKRMQARVQGFVHFTKLLGPAGSGCSIYKINKTYGKVEEAISMHRWKDRNCFIVQYFGLLYSD
jgi:hypothetical protein